MIHFNLFTDPDIACNKNVLSEIENINMTDPQRVANKVSIL
jgi:hypothetical protein